MVRLLTQSVSYVQCGPIGLGVSTMSIVMGLFGITVDVPVCFTTLECETCSP